MVDGSKVVQMQIEGLTNGFMAHTTLLWLLGSLSLVMFIGTIIALPLIITQLVLELRSGTLRHSPTSGMDVPQFEGGERFRDLKTWGWLVGLLVAVWLIGFMVAVPLFVFVFSIIHGARWYVSVFLSAMAFGLLYGIFDVVVHVSWPEPFVLRWLAS